VIPEVYLPESRTMITLEVRRREFLTPGFASVTLAGPAVRDLVVAGNDLAVRLFFPRQAQTALRMPTVSNEAWIAQLMLVPKSVRPWVRNLTIRRARPAGDTWAAGESRLATTVRRHLVNDRGVPKRDISFFGYWRLGRSAPG